MKKVLILFVVVLMCLSSFAGITPAEETPDSTNITFLTDENIFVKIFADDDTYLGLEIYNKSNDEISIVWDEFALTDNRDKKSKILKKETKYSDMDLPQQNTSIKPYDTLKSYIAPKNNIYKIDDLNYIVSISERKKELNFVYVKNNVKIFLTSSFDPYIALELVKIVKEGQTVKSWAEIGKAVKEAEKNLEKGLKDIIDTTNTELKKAKDDLNNSLNQLSIDMIKGAKFRDFKSKSIGIAFDYYFFSPEWSYDNEKELVVFTGSCYYNYKIAEIKMTFLIKNGSFNSSTFINGVLLSDYEEKKFLKEIYK